MQTWVFTVVDPFPSYSLAALSGGFNATMPCMTCVQSCRQPEARQAADALHQDNVEASDCVETADASEAEGRAAGQVDTDR